MCFSTVGMRANGVGSTDVIVDADFLPIWGTDGVVGNLRPRRLAVSEFCCSSSVAVMFADGVVQFTADDAANLVTRFAAMRKWLVGITGIFSTA